MGCENVQSGSKLQGFWLLTEIKRHRGRFAGRQGRAGGHVPLEMPVDECRQQSVLEPLTEKLGDEEPAETREDQVKGRQGARRPRRTPSEQSDSWRNLTYGVKYYRGAKMRKENGHWL